jgi:hypothetical protein
MASLRGCATRAKDSFDLVDIYGEVLPARTNGTPPGYEIPGKFRHINDIAPYTQGTIALDVIPASPLFFLPHPALPKPTLFAFAHLRRRITF